jgi:inner membrane protein
LLFALAYLAGLSHLLLDFTNNYGIRPFVPFSYRWYSWDIVFIVEPLLWVFLLLIGLLMPALFSLVDRESGARRKGRRGRLAAISALVLMAALWGLRDFEHRRAVAAVNSLAYRDEDPVRVSAYPYYVNPFHWYAVVETRDLFASMDVDSLGAAVDPTGQALIRYKPRDTPLTLAAKQSHLGRVFLDWAQYPYLEVQPLGDPAQPHGSLVRFYDLRFAYTGLRRSTLGAWVEVGPDLRIVAESFDTRRFSLRGLPVEHR